MSCDCCHRLVRQLFDLRRNFTDAKPCVNQQRAVFSFKKIAMRFLPMPVFADDMRMVVNFIYRKPWLNLNASFSLYECPNMGNLSAVGRFVFAYIHRRLLLEKYK
jgi:hypothetical protein